jgi:hypothetical protein
MSLALLTDQLSTGSGTKSLNSDRGSDNAQFCQGFYTLYTQVTDEHEITAEWRLAEETDEVGEKIAPVPRVNHEINAE